MIDELDFVDDTMRLNTSICRMCLGVKSMPLRVAGDGLAVRCPDGTLASFNEPAPQSCKYIVEHSLLRDEPLPLPIVEED